MRQSFQVEVCLPNVVIEDPVRQKTYYIPYYELDKFLVTSKNQAIYDSRTVTFVILSESDIEEVRPFINAYETEPSVVIQCRKNNNVYFLSNDILETFRIDIKPAINNKNTIIFTIPLGWELIEELSSIRRIGQSEIDCDC